MDKDNNRQATSTVPAQSTYMDIQKKNAFESKPTVPTTTATKPVQSTTTEAKTPATTATAADATAQTSPQGHELTLAPGNRHENVDAQEVAYRKIMEANMPESDADKAKREKRERAKKIIAAVGDGLSSIANIYFATKGAPNMYNPDNGMSARLREQLDKDAADREAKKAKFLEASLARGKRREEIANAERAAEVLRRREAREEQEEQRKQESHKWLAALQPDKQREAKGNADKAGYEAISAAYDAANAPALAGAKLAAEKALANQRNASANASGAAATNSLASAAEHNRGNLQEFSAWDKQGNEHKFKTKAAADEFARREGTFQPLSNTKTVDAGRQSRTEKTSSGRGYAKKVAPQPKKDADNAPPSKRKAAEAKANNDNTPPSRRNK